MRSVRFMAMAMFGCLVSLAASSAMAQTVKYSVQGRFNGSGSFTTDAVISTGTGSLTFNGLTDTVIDVDPADGFSFTSLGKFTTAATAATPIPAGVTFELRITQIDPTAGSTDVSATLSGTVRPTASTGVVDFATNTVVLGPVTYTILTDPLALVPPSSNGGVSTIQGRIDVVPEPASLGLVGFAAMGLLARRRRVA